jgi:hypothetical protein
VEAELTSTLWLTAIRDLHTRGGRQRMEGLLLEREGRCSEYKVERICSIVLITTSTTPSSNNNQLHFFPFPSSIS